MLTLGKKTLSVPILQGGMGVGVSLGGLAGAVAGDHCSPISDTTILSSAGAGCNHIEHVSTQLPYALLVAFCSAVGYLVAGLSGGNLWLSFGTSLGLLIVAVIVLHNMRRRKPKIQVA